MTSHKEAHELISQGKAILVDVRESNEIVQTGLAEGAIWMPLSAMQDDLEQWRIFRQQLVKDKLIFVYCASGARSGRFAEFLCCDGYKAENLGGFREWQSAGLPVKPFQK